ncbi:MAG: universal stress protein [Deinococcales bacterium]|nr:universal stress protein [Deinococcales bacterium]
MRILHPTDFSQPAQKALQLARDLRARLDGSIHVVHVQRRFEAERTGSRPQLDTFNPALLDHREEQRAAEVERLRGMLSHLASPDGSFELLWGNPVEELLAIQERYDLVVMGAHGANRFDLHFLGGVAGRFVRRASVPVVTVRDEAPSLAVRRVLVATDFGAASTAAWEFAGRLARAGVELVLGHVVDDERLASDPDHTSAVTEQLSRMAGGAASRLVVREGDPALVLPRMATEVGADLVAIGIRQHRGAVGLLLGSRADALLRSSTVPVLSVPALLD